ncbi:YceD family protein [Legionella septentrionalis]|uniref:Metal-binding protein n=1 Tax=Legionella septentrionalis TaxID=2498109 RepID=A0A3S0XS94_9GAMM|nr:metal-binding protein [Legionella septentrionalis]RUQ81885.1 metal-binding protein [Legionella septentrionalis]RUR00255.1 metal-binding protein [Legionella septentrionalis]
MKICLKTLAKEANAQSFAIRLDHRLPPHVDGVCQLVCDIQVEERNDYYLLSLQARGDVRIICQRCLTAFPFLYENQTQIAICSQDEIAERLMEQYECIVLPGSQVDLTEILIDDLYLFTPEKHENLEDCDVETRSFIHEENEMHS